MNDMRERARNFVLAIEQQVDGGFLDSERAAIVRLTEAFVGFERDAAKQAGREEAAAWHDAQAEKYNQRHDGQAREYFHYECAAAIRGEKP